LHGEGDSFWPEQAAVAEAAEGRKPVNLIEHVLGLFSEAATKPGIMSLVGIRRENACRKDVAAYFDVLWQELEKEELVKVAGETPDSALHTAYMKIRRAMRQAQPVLLHALSGHIYLALLDGDKVARRQMKQEFKEAGPQTTPPPPPPPDQPSLFDTIMKSIDTIGITGQQAADYAAQRAATQVRGINDTTLKILRQAIQDGIEQQLGVDGLSRLIRDSFRSMSVTRAKMIASTEMNDAFSEAAIRNMKRLGVEYKQLILAPDACPICDSIESKGPIPVDEPFVDFEGEEYDRTPIHPNCRCATVGARPPEEPAAEEEDVATVAN
jgi:hypothetical protein